MTRNPALNDQVVSVTGTSWKPKDAGVEGVARNMDAIRSTERHEIPIDQFEEMRYLARLGEEA